jgi:hypothetical protein
LRRRSRNRVNLVGRVLLRLLQLLHDRVVGIFLSARPCSAAGQNGCGGRKQEWPVDSFDGYAP